MADAEDEPDEEADEPSPSFSEEDRLAMVAALRSAFDWVEPATALSLQTVRWTPDLVSQINPSTVCHLNLVGRLRDVWTERLREARAARHVPLVAAPQECWTDQTLEVAHDLGIAAVVLSRTRKGWRAKHFDSVPRLLAQERRLLETDLRERMCERAYARAMSSGNSFQRGRAFEDFLLLLFSQISFLEVKSFDFHNATEEIDIVLEDRRATAYGASVVIVSAKNVKSPVDVQALNDLEVKMRNRGAKCKLGFLCSSRKIAGTVDKAALRFSRDDVTVVLLDGTRLQRLAAADDFEKELLEEIFAAKLR